MEKKIINNFADLEKFVGVEIGVSDYHHITQEQINKFAEATLDYQWIHTDPEKAKVESPFQNTIAHGYLTLSLLPYLWNQIVDVRNLKLMVNYGMEDLRFNQPVLVDSKVRLKVVLSSLQDLRGITKAKMKVTLEIEGNKKPAYDAIAVFLYHFNN